MKRVLLVLLALTLILGVVALAQDTMKHDDMKKSGTMKHDDMKKSDNKAMGKAQNITGWVADEKCGTSKVGTQAGSDCAKKCIESGQKIVFVTEKDKKVWQVDNPEALKGHEGHHVKLNAHVNNDAGSIHVESVKMMAAAKAKKEKAS